MPRFGVSPLGSSPASMGFESPSLRFPTMQSPPESMHSPHQFSPSMKSPSMYSPTSNAGELIAKTPGPNDRASSSVNLCCITGDGSALFSLGCQSGTYFVERQTLPLHDETVAQSQPQLRLSQLVQSSLKLSPPIGLVYVEASNEGSSVNATTQLLCLYTRKRVFYLEVGSQSVEVSEAFQQYWMSTDPAVNIVRIRPAPQRRNDFATLCPRGAMAMLTHEPDVNRYSLVLQHSKEQDLVSRPLMFQLEDLSSRDNIISDFCFAQSEGLGLLSSLTTLFVKGSGEILAASPILFDGCVVPQSKLTECMDFLDYQILAAPEQTKAKRNQCKAAKSFLLDAFGDLAGGNKSHFRTAHVLSGRLYTPVTWPVQIQGPIMYMPRDHQHESNCAVVIENFVAPDLIGVAVGGEGYSIDVGIVSPSFLLPRFDMMSAEDRHVLDDALSQSGIIVQRLVLNGDEGEGSLSTGPLTNGSLALVRDPLIDSMIHYVVSSGVTTVNTSVVRQVSLKIHGEAGKDTPAKTSAWSSVTVSSGRVEGAIVGNDTRCGHVLIVRLSDGAMVPVNVTESRYLHEMDHLTYGEMEEEPQKLAVQSTPSHLAAQKLESIGPLYEAVGPLTKKIAAGLAGMSKIVGSKTMSKDIQPDMMAIAINIKERCDNEVLLHMLELRETVNARRVILKNMVKDQRRQIDSLKQTVDSLKKRMFAIEAKAETAQENSTQLAMRSSNLLQASQDLLPSLTQAEYNYFQQLKRLEADTKSNMERYGKLENVLKTLRHNMDQGRIRCSVDLGDWVETANKLLDGEDFSINEMEKRMEDNKERLRKLMEISGLIVTSPPDDIV